MKKIIVIIIWGVLIASCGQNITFEQQIVNDIKTKIPSGICKKFPKGTLISNIKVGEIVEIAGSNGMTDVTYEFDYEINGETKHEKSAMLYIKRGKTYLLASLGSDCDYELKNK